MSANENEAFAKDGGAGDTQDTRAERRRERMLARVREGSAELGELPQGDTTGNTGGGTRGDTSGDTSDARTARGGRLDRSDISDRTNGGPTPRGLQQDSPPTSRRSGDGPVDASEQSDGVSGQRSEENTNAINGKPRGRPVGRRPPQQQSDASPSVDTGRVSVAGLARGFREKVTEPVADATQTAAEATGEQIGRLTARAPRPITRSVSRQFGPQATVAGEILTELDPEQAGDVSGEVTGRLGEGVGRGGATILNVPRTAIDTKRAAEFVAEGAEATLEGEGGKIVEGDVLAGEADILEGGFAERRVEPAATRVVEDARRNPIQTGGELVGGAIVSAGTLSALRRFGGPRVQRAGAVAVQPGEEALITGARAGVVPTRVASTVGDLSPEAIKGGDRKLFDGGTDRGQADLTLRGSSSGEVETEFESEFDGVETGDLPDQIAGTSPFPSDISRVPDTDLRVKTELEPETSRVSPETRQRLQEAQRLESGTQPASPQRQIEDLTVPGKPFTGLDVTSAGRLATPETDLETKSDQRVELDAINLQDQATRTEVRSETDLEPRLDSRLDLRLDQRLEQRLDTRLEQDLRSETGLRGRTRIEPRIEGRTEVGVRSDTRTEQRQEQRLELRSEPRQEQRVEGRVELEGSRRELSFDEALETDRDEDPDGFDFDLTDDPTVELPGDPDEALEDIFDDGGSQ